MEEALEDGLLQVHYNSYIAYVHLIIVLIHENFMTARNLQMDLLFSP